MDATIRVESTGGDTATITVSPAYRDRPLTVVLARAGFVLNTRCGQKGLCRGCEVQRENGETVKACQLAAATQFGSLIRIPERSLLRGSLSVAVDFQPRCAFELRPIVQPSGRRDLGLCIDIGTTTVVMILVDLRDGKILGRASGYNAQVRMGEDVLTRIEACSRSPEAVSEGQSLMLEDTLTPLWQDLSGQTGCDGERLAGVVVAGNTTMLHLLVGEDPTLMGRVPFTPAFLEARQLPHSAFPWQGREWAGAEEVPWHLLPGFAAYVGSDLAAGWLASGMCDHEGTTLLVDIGTNGEILLHHGRALTGCATAAGPAFEGTQLSWGCRAVEGAVSRIHGNPLEPQSLVFEYVLKRKPRAPGFCGSAYLDFMAVAAESGLLTPSGRFDLKRAQAAGIELVQSDYGRSWLLNPRDPLGPSISEADIALLLQAKAAIAAGIQILLGQSGLAQMDVERVYLAGGFGLNLGIDSAIRCGLLAGFRREQIEVVGNSSLGGAYVCLLDHIRATELEQATRKAHIIELNEDPGFEDTYIDHLNLEAPGSP